MALCLEKMPVDFNEFWKRGPWLKLGKKEAERHFRATVKTDSDINHICVARDRYAVHLALHPWKQPQHGKTWFNNWRDWVDYEEPALQHIHSPMCREAGFCCQGRRNDDDSSSAFNEAVDALRKKHGV